MPFNNDLLESLTSVSTGAGNSGVHLPLMCPDSLHKPHMQDMLNVVYLHSCRWRYDFNHKKSHVLIFGPDTCPTRILTLGNNEISPLQDDSHLGVPLSTNTPGMDRAIQHRIRNYTRGNFTVAYRLGGVSTQYHQLLHLNCIGPNDS